MSYITHNLDIHSYNLEEFFQLLDLPLAPTKEQMLLAKKKVMMFHPDKSTLPNEYFIFYKKVFDITLKYYEEQNKQNRLATEDNTTYNASNLSTNQSIDKEIKKNIDKISGKGFNSKFNEIFEKTIMEKKENNNAWFAEEKPAIDVPINETVSIKNMGTIFEKIKDKTHSLVVHKGVQDFSYNVGGNFFDNDQDKNEYISSDPFGKLKFDDLRKVHKDQTIFAVGENDFKKVAQYSSVDHYMRERDRDPVTPLEKAKAEMFLQEKEKIMKEQHLRNLHSSNLKTMTYKDKNKEFLASFLRLDN